MFAVEVYAAVRRFAFVEGHSRREAARVFGLSRPPSRSGVLIPQPPYRLSAAVGQLGITRTAGPPSFRRTLATTDAVLFRIPLATGA